MAFTKLLPLVFCMTLPGSALAAENWPIKFFDPSSLEKTPPADTRTDPQMSQPQGFDPARDRNAKDTNLQTVTEVWKDNKPYSLTEYYFDTDGDPSYVLEFKRGGKRHALYTEVSQYKTSPDRRTLVLTNYVKQTRGWLELNRIVDVASKKTAAIPAYDCAQFYASVTNAHVVTYDSGTRRSDGTPGSTRAVCIWDFAGKWQHALEAPVQNTVANTEESPNSMGLLAAEETTFYMLSYANAHCVLRLQGLGQPFGTREIQLPAGVFGEEDKESLASGAYGDPCWEGSAVDIDMSRLTLKGGELRFRVAKSGRADLDGKWLDWVSYK
jgi:hypothetical protein